MIHQDTQAMEIEAPERRGAERFDDLAESLEQKSPLLLYSDIHAHTVYSSLARSHTHNQECGFASVVCCRARQRLRDG
jgi:hypothetical protein